MADVCRHCAEPLGLHTRNAAGFLECPGRDGSHFEAVDYDAMAHQEILMRRAKEILLAPGFIAAAMHATRSPVGFAVAIADQFMRAEDGLCPTCDKPLMHEPTSDCPAP